MSHGASHATATRMVERAAVPERAKPDCGCAAEASTAGLPRYLGGQLIQPKLEVGAPDDAFEREADAVSTAVERDEPVRTERHPATPPRFQRLCVNCAEQLMHDDGLLQRRPGGHSDTAGAAGESASGLSPVVRGRLERTLGTDLGSVQVHTGPTAQTLARGLGAKAFTHGQHIWLGARQRPDDLGLMAHEVTHVLQQTVGSTMPERVQRSPAEHRHPEDGGAVLARMNAKIRDAERGHEHDGAHGDHATNSHSARRAESRIDRGELSAKRAEVAPAARPDVNRPAAEAPKVQSATSGTKQVADSPPKPVAEAKGAEAGKGDKAGGKGAEAKSAAAAAAGLANAAFAATGAISQPQVEPQVRTPAAVTPVDAGGAPLPPHPEADQHVVALAQDAQTLRQQGTRTRTFASEEKGNSQLLRGNITLVRTGIEQAETGVAKSREHLTFRQGVLAQAKTGLKVSEEKAAKVAAEAPNYSSKADEGKAESGPMASEAHQMVAENAAHTPDDPDAAASAREQGGKMSQAGADIGTTDDAITQTQARAASLASEAAQAKQTNSATAAKIHNTETQLAATSAKLGQMAGQNAAAKAHVSNLARAPDVHTRQAAAIDERGLSQVALSHEIESRLHAVQNDYAQDMRGVPKEEVPATTPPETGPDMLVQRTPDDGSTEPPPDISAMPPPVADAGASPPTEAAAPAPPPTPPTGTVAAPPDESAATATHVRAAIAAARDEGTHHATPKNAGAAKGSSTEPEGGSGAPAGPVAGPAATGGPAEAVPPPEPIQINTAGAVSEDLPSWVTGVEPPNAEERRRAADAAEHRRADQIAEIEAEAKDGFQNLSATDKMGIALRLTGRNLFGSVGHIHWPGWGHLAVGLIDPRGPLMGVVSGLGKMASGVANLASGAQWRRDPLGNLLKSAADIATGLTIVLGSITALAGVIIAIMTAITILSFGTAAPVTGPVIAFCTTVLTTVGGWTISVGEVALVLQALVLIKNLIDAACAQSAADLQSEADQLTENVSDAGGVVMQMGMAKLAQVGGRTASEEIEAAGGGVRYAAAKGARAATTVRALPGRLVAGARTLPGRLVAGARALPGTLAEGASGLGARVAGGARALPGRFVAGARALPSRIAGGVREFPGNIVRGVRGFPGSLRASIGKGLSRKFLVGEDIGNLGMARSAAAESRAAVWAEARTPGGILAREARGLSSEARDLPGHQAPQVVEHTERISSAPTEARAAIRKATPATGAEREASVAQSSHIDNEHVTPRDAANEVALVDENPAMVEGQPPHQRARLGDHEIVETPGGGCERHSPSGLQIPCPISFEGVPGSGRAVGRDAAAIRSRLEDLLGTPLPADLRGDAQALARLRSRIISTSTEIEAALARGDMDAADSLLEGLEIRLHHQGMVKLPGAPSSPSSIARLHAKETAQPDVYSTEQMRTSGLRRDDPTWSQAAAQVEENRSLGRLAEEHGQAFLVNHFDDVQPQVRIRPLLDNGQPAPFYFITDNLGRSRAGGQIVAFDSKLSSSAPLTTNQAIGYPLFSRNGGIVESRTAGPYAYGTRLGVTQSTGVQTFRLQPRFRVNETPAVAPTSDFFRLARIE